MTRLDILHELKRENAARKFVFPRWVQTGKLSRGAAKIRIQRMVAAEAFFETLSDEEYEQVMARLEIKPGGDAIQGELF